MPVSVDSLSITVPAKGGAIEVITDNNAWNLQILMPFAFTITCKSGPCVAPGIPVGPAPTLVFNGADKGPAGTDEYNVTGNCFRIPQLATAPE